MGVTKASVPDPSGEKDPSHSVYEVVDEKEPMCVNDPVKQMEGRKRLTAENAEGAHQVFDIMPESALSSQNSEEESAKACTVCHKVGEGHVKVLEPVEPVGHAFEDTFVEKSLISCVLSGMCPDSVEEQRQASLVGMFDSEGLVRVYPKPPNILVSVQTVVEQSALMRKADGKLGNAEDVQLPIGGEVLVSAKAKQADRLQQAEVQPVVPLLGYVGAADQRVPAREPPAHQDDPKVGLKCALPGGNSHSVSPRQASIMQTEEVVSGLSMQQLEDAVQNLLGVQIGDATSTQAELIAERSSSKKGKAMEFGMKKGFLGYSNKASLSLTKTIANLTKMDFDIVEGVAKEETGIDEGTTSRKTTGIEKRNGFDWSEFTNKDYVPPCLRNIPKNLVCSNPAYEAMVNAQMKDGETKKTEKGKREGPKKGVQWGSKQHGTS